MSIADRLTSMSNNLSNAYDGIEYLGVDTTGVDKNLQNLSTMLNVVYEGLPKVSDEGISPSIDGSRVGRLKSTLKASDTQQDNTKITYKCVGTETGTYYFTYNSVNYQFTMPTITSSSVLVFDTVALKLYLDSTEVATSTGTSGTQLTFISSPNPDYPQNIHVVKGNNTVEVCGLNVINLLNYTRLVNNSCTDRVINKNDISFTNSGIWGNISLMFENINKNQDYYLYYKVSSIVSRTCGIKIYGTDVLEFASSDITAIYDGVFDLQANEIKEKNGTFNSGNYKYIILRFWGNASATSLGTATEIKYQDVMLKKGTSEAPYEPYNGTTYSIYLGGNVFNLNDIEENKYIIGSTGVISSSTSSNVSGYILAAENATYRLTFDYVSLSSTNTRGMCFYDENKNYLSGTTIPMTNKNQTITIPNGASYLRFAYDKNLTDISLSTDMTPIELCKINTYQDKLFKAVSGDTVYDSLTAEQKEGLVSGGWYKYAETWKHIFDGTENWQMTYGTSLFNFDYRSIMPIKKPNSNAISDYFIFDSRESGMSTMPNNKFAIQGNYTGIFFRNNYITTASDFETWLSTHNTTVYYVLATPTITQITDTTLISQLEALYSAMSKNGQTNVLQTNTDNPFVIYASALKGE